MWAWATIPDIWWDLWSIYACTCTHWSTGQKTLSQNIYNMHVNSKFSLKLRLPPICIQGHEIKFYCTSIKQVFWQYLNFCFQVLPLASWFLPDSVTLKPSSKYGEARVCDANPAAATFSRILCHSLMEINKTKNTCVPNGHHSLICKFCDFSKGLGSDR